MFKNNEKKLIGKELPKTIRTYELWISTIVGFIFLAVILTISITAIVLGNNVIKLNQVDLNNEQGFEKAKQALELLSNINDQLNIALRVSLEGIIPILVIFLLTRIGCNVALWYSEYFCYQTIFPNRKAYQLNCIKRSINIFLIILVMFGACAYISLIKNDLYQPAKIVFNKIDSVFNYIQDNNGSVTNMTLEWWNKHANELQKKMLDIVNTFNDQRKIILDVIHDSSFKNPALGYMITFIVALVLWFASVVGFSSKSLSIKKKNYQETVPANDLSRLNDYYYND